MGLLAGKVALVTGGGQGIGRGIVLCFAREGAKVVVAEIDKEHGERCAEEARSLGAEAVFVSTDVGAKSQVYGAVDAAVQRFGRLDVLVNNAVKLPTPRLFERKTDELFEEQLRICLWGTWWGMQAAQPVMAEQGGGRIINFTSGDLEAGSWLHADYAAAKGGIQALTRTAAQEWARFNILVNALAPVAASSAFERMCRERPGFRERAAAGVPLGRMGDPEHDIAPVALFLASDLARFMTGVILPVDGGKHLPRGESRPTDLSLFE